ncbi:MAG: Mur ligase family protein, partial [Pseudoclavibacter sp.]
MRLRGGGSAVPGRVALAIAPDFLRTAVEGLPLGVVFVSGSNGKSTTTHFLTTMLRAHGLKVFSNSSGGNLPQGIASSMLPDVGSDGRLQADIAVLEVDEAFGPQLLEHLHPRGVLLLNVQVDQLNRFYDPTRVAGFLETIANACDDFAVLNADDESLRGLGERLTQPVSWFGVSDDLVRSSPNGLSNFETAAGAPAAIDDDFRTVQVTALADRRAQLRIGGAVEEVALPARG